ncbi:MAG: hypothetical protein AB3N63_11405 [Puniceicoccaceae bacterium]
MISRLPPVAAFIAAVTSSLFTNSAWGALDFDNLKSRNPKPPSAHIHEVTYQNGRWILGSDGGYITHSPDGENWSTVTTEYDKGIEAVIYWDGRYFAGGVDGGTLLESPDIVNWTKLNVWATGYPGNMREFHPAFGKLYAVGYSPGLAATTDGIAWTEVTFPSGSQNLESMASNNTLAVVVGNDGIIMTSENGTDWTDRSVTIPNMDSTLDDDILVVRWVNGMFVAGGKQGLLLSSPDGITWTHYPNDRDDWFYNVLYKDGSYILPARQGRILTTTNFTDFTEIDVGTNQTWQDIFLFGDRIVAAGREGNVAYSDNITNWTTTSNGTRQFLRHIAYGADVFVVTDSGGGILKSNDSEAWNLVFEEPNTWPMYGLRWDGSQFVAMSGEGRLHTSMDGETWTAAAEAAIARRVENFTHVNGLYWALGADGLIASSADLTSWNELTIGGHRFYGICHGNGLYVATGYSEDNTQGIIFTSPDGVNWTERDPGYPEADGLRIYTCIYADGKYVAGGSGRSLTHSTDGITWTYEDDPITTPFIFNKLTYVDGKFHCLSVSGRIYISEDGISWTSIRLRTTRGLEDYIEAGGRTVVVGTSGTILSTDLDLGPTYAAWKAERFTPTQQADDAISGSGADPDMDGRSNAFEFFSNTQPLVAEAGQPYTLELVNVGQTVYPGLTIRRSNDLAGVSLRILYSTDLDNFSELIGPALIEVSVTPLDEDTDQVLYRSNTPLQQSDFLQIEVVLEE